MVLVLEIDRVQSPEVTVKLRTLGEWHRLGVFNVLCGDGVGVHVVFGCHGLHV